MKKNPDAAKPSAPEHKPLALRFFGGFIVVVALAVLITAVSQWFADTARIRAGAVVKVIKEVAPLRSGWQLELPGSMKDPRSVQIWDYRDAQNSLAAHERSGGAGEAVGPTLAETQLMLLVKGTDGKKETQVIGVVDAASGKPVWMKPYNDLPLDYCLDQLWESSMVCESKKSKKVVRIDPTGNVTPADLPNGIWDLATGEHVIGTIFDRFLVVPIGVKEGASAGVEAQFINPDFTYKKRFQVLVPNSQAAKPLLVQSRGSITLVGALTSAADGSNLQSTWSFSQLINVKIGNLDLSNLGSAPQASLLEAGFFASSDPKDAAKPQGSWKLYNPDGTVSAQGQAPVVALQAMHAQLRNGLPLDLTAAANALKSGRVPVIMKDRTYFLGAAGETCQNWPGCAATDWKTGDGVQIRLKEPGEPLLSNQTTVVFRSVNGMVAYGVVDGKFLWQGVTPPQKGAATTEDPTPFGKGLGQLAQIGDIQKGNAKAVLTFWNLP